VFQTRGNCDDCMGTNSGFDLPLTLELEWHPKP
jgi:hypothetical protein